LKEIKELKAIDQITALDGGRVQNCPDMNTCTFPVTPAYFIKFCRAKHHTYMECIRYAQKYGLLKTPMSHLQNLALAAEDGSPILNPS